LGQPQTFIKKGIKVGCKKDMRKKKLWKTVIVAVLLLAVMAGAGFYLYTKDYYHAKTQECPPGEETEDYLVYGDKESPFGIIFYPGAKVEERAYGQIFSRLSENGICCVVVKMPYHLAVLGRDAAKQVIEEIPGVKHWYIGGHSLGGAMAADFAAEQGQDFDGVILLAAYPTKDLGSIPVLSVYGDRDGVLNRKKYRESLSYAEDLTEHVIKGGNHAGFGDYGEQKGDNAREVTEEEQWQETVRYILDFLLETRGLKELEFSFVISSQLAKNAETFFVSEGIYCIYDDEKYFYINQYGEPLTGDVYTRAYPFCEGLACVYKDGKYGFIDREGSVAVPFAYDDVSSYVEGLAYFCKDGRYGFMDKTGKPEFYLDCDSVSTFSEGLAYICVDGRYGYIDKKGKMVTELIFDDAECFQDGFAEVVKDSKRGVIDRTGRFVIPPEYVEIQKSETYFRADKDEKYEMFDLEGNALREEPCGQVSLFQAEAAEYLDYSFSKSGSNDVRLFNYYDYQDGYVIVQTGETETEKEDLSELLFGNHITPRAEKFHEFLQGGSFSVDDMQDSHEIRFSECNGDKILCKLYDFSHTGRPVLYVYIKPYEYYNFPKSHSGFFTLEGEEIICQLSGFECGGSARGDRACLWYDREEEKILYGTAGILGGIGGYCTYNYVYDDTDAVWSPWMNFKHMGAQSETEFSVNGEGVTREHYLEVEERFELVKVPR